MVLHSFLFTPRHGENLLYSSERRVRRVFYCFAECLGACRLILGGDGVTTEEKKLWAMDMLRAKEREIGRLPKKDDFDEVTRARIKAFLGPWPRALEAAGLKEPKPQPAKPGKRRKPASKPTEKKGDPT